MRTSPSRPTRTISQPAYLTEFVTEVLSHRSRSSQGQAVPSGPARRTRARAAQQADQHDIAGAGLGGGEGGETVCYDEDRESVNGDIGEGGQGCDDYDDSVASGGEGEQGTIASMLPQPEPGYRELHSRLEWGVRDVTVMVRVMNY